jgi:hypothetical protein
MDSEIIFEFAYIVTIAFYVATFIVAIYGIWRIIKLIITSLVRLAGTRYGQKNQRASMAGSEMSDCKEGGRSEPHVYTSDGI